MPIGTLVGIEFKIFTDVRGKQQGKFKWGLFHECFLNQCTFMHASVPDCTYLCNNIKWMWISR